MASREVTVHLTADVREFVAAGFGDPNVNPELRTAICDWLRSNGIDPALVPADEKPTCGYRDGQTGHPLGGHTITTRIRIRCAPASQGILIPHLADRPAETTITKSMVVPPSTNVQQWLDAKCPTCGR